MLLDLFEKTLKLPLKSKVVTQPYVDFWLTNINSTTMDFMELSIGSVCLSTHVLSPLRLERILMS